MNLKMYLEDGECLISTVRHGKGGSIGFVLVWSKQECFGPVEQSNNPVPYDFKSYSYMYIYIN
jgi:hypothetical protein